MDLALGVVLGIGIAAALTAVWKAVRASSSIPGVLPPVFGRDGAMLVDGGIADNVPIEPMAGLKRGPNVVV